MRRFILICVLATMAAPVAARPAEDKKDARDPNRVVCKTTDVIGSRLQKKKTCMTAQQWDEFERDQRNTVDRVQAFKPHTGG
jgi:hypothetical protein